jgi:hypothetical protein
VTSEYKRQKTDLAESVSKMEVKGFVFWLKGNMNFPIPAQMHWKQETVNTPPQTYLPFPLVAGSNTTISNFSTHATTMCTLYWGLLPIFQGGGDWDTGICDCTCEMASITTPAGTYDAYNVSVGRFWGIQAHDYNTYYYVPEIGNVVKQTNHKDWDSNGRTWYDQEWELISTTYEP